MQILVTGGAGFIGSIMVKKLLDDGHTVLVIDSLERGYKEAIDKRATLKVGTLLDKNFISSCFSDVGFDAVIHFAGYIAMEESIKQPGFYFDNNVTGALNLLEEVRKHNIGSFIFSSTAGVYGNPIQTPIVEDHPKNPTNPYGESKRMVEQMLSWYEKIYNLSFVSLRYFNAAGAMLDGSLGENHNPETHLIPNAILAALYNTKVSLYGDDYDTPDKTCIRDYIHVEDLVEAHVLALEKLRKDKGGFFYNVGTGVGHSNREVIEMVKKISGTDFLVSVEKRRPGDANMLVSDPTRIKKELGFNPKYSDLKTIIKTAWKWHAKNSKLSPRGEAGKVQSSK